MIFVLKDGFQTKMLLLMYLLCVLPAGSWGLIVYSLIEFAQRNKGSNFTNLSASKKEAIHGTTSSYRKYIYFFFLPVPKLNTLEILNPNLYPPFNQLSVVFGI